MATHKEAVFYALVQQKSRFLKLDSSLGNKKEILELNALMFFMFVLFAESDTKIAEL